MVPEMGSQLTRTIALVALLLPVCLAGALKAEKASLESGGQKHEYFVFAPKAAEEKPGAPMLVLLHGSGRDGMSQINEWKDLASSEGIVLVAPNAVNSRMWQLPQDGPDPMIAIADTVREKYHADANRVYLFGHSAGAVFSLFMACEKPHYFAAIAVHAGAVRESDEADVARVAKEVDRKTPIFVQVGSDDPFFPPAAVRRTQTLFQEAGFPFDVKEIPHHDHTYYAISKNVNRDAWAFLKDKTLDGEAK